MSGFVININKVGNIEFENTLLKYRMPLSELTPQDTPLEEIEKNLKRKLVSLENTTNFLIPSQIETINSSIIFYYQLEGYKSFEYLRQLRFRDKLKYFTSLVEIGKNENVKVIWNRYNFVVDELEEKLKSIIFETENMKVYEESDPLNGIKNLVLTSLTSLNILDGQVIRPQRNDFIDKDDEVIKFAEMLLKIETLDDLDDYINTKLLEIEHGIEEENESKQTKKKTGNLEGFKLFSKSNKNENNKYKKNNSANKSKGNNKKQNKLMIFGGIFAVLLLIFNAIISNNDPVDGEKEKQEYVDVNVNKKSNSGQENDETMTDPKYNDILLEAYRESLTNKNESAIKKLEKVGYENLSNVDKTIMLNIYTSGDKLAKVIDLDPDRAMDILNKLIADGKEEDIVKIQKEMKTKNPYVDFEVAYLNQDYKKVISLKDKIELNGRKEQQIVDSYIALEKYSEGKKFAVNVGNPDLINELETYDSVSVDEN